MDAAKFCDATKDVTFSFEFVIVRLLEFPIKSKLTLEMVNQWSVWGKKKT